MPKLITNKLFIEQCNIIHNNFYDYSLVNYINNKTKIKIICKEHGIFEQRPDDHLKNHGCPICKESKGEKEIRNYLINNNIRFESQKKFKKCRYLKPLPFDFYLPDYNLCIEYDGEQHFMLKEFWGGQKEFEKIQRKDKIKNIFCEKENISLIRIKYDDNIIDKLSKIKL
jgi:very-short-patch-repair endonuclease